MNRKSGLIFDMDGTLIKENRYWKVSSAVAFDLVKESVPFSFIQESKNRGVNSNWEICFNFVKGKTKVTYEEVKELFQKKLAEINPVDELIVDEKSFSEVFSVLKGRYEFFIATARPRSEALEAVNNTSLRLFFNSENIFAKEDVPVKSLALKEELLKLIAAKAKPRNFFAIGDTMSDVLSAKSLGLKAIGVYGSLNNKEFLKNAGADFLIEDISFLPEVLLCKN